MAYVRDGGWWRAATTVWAIVAAAACSGATSVRPLGGRYLVISVNGLSLRWPENPSSINPQIAGGSLSVGPDTLSVFLSLQRDRARGRGHCLLRGKAPVFPTGRLLGARRRRSG